MRLKKHNEGFSLVELLIAMAILSIIMLMVVQFMSTSSAANERTQYNMKAQTASNELINNLNTTLSMANYVRVVPCETGGTKQSQVYVKDGSTDGTRLEAMKTVAESSLSVPALTSDATTFTFDLVPDSYGNYVRTFSNVADLSDEQNYKDQRKVIVDMNNFRLPGEKKGTYYPLDSDTIEKDKNVRSFRCMKKILSDNSECFLYMKPSYIYIEYYNRTSTGEQLQYAIYQFDYVTDSDGNEVCSVYLKRGDLTNRNQMNRYTSAKTAINAIVADDKANKKQVGLLTDTLSDFYLSCDAEAGAFMVDFLMDVNGYMYNGKSIINLRNSQVLTERPQNSFKSNEKSEDYVAPDDESGGGGTEDDNSSESDSSEIPDSGN